MQPEFFANSTLTPHRQTGIVIANYRLLQFNFETAKRHDDSKLREARQQLLDEMGDFLVSHPWRSIHSLTLRKGDEKDYAGYWFSSSPERIAPLLSDRRFLAALDAYREGALSYGGLLEKLYGDKCQILFPELGLQVSRLVVAEMANAIERGDILIPNGLRSEFPHLYEFYDPEAFGHKPTS